MTFAPAGERNCEVEIQKFECQGSTTDPKVTNFKLSIARLEQCTPFAAYFLWSPPPRPRKSLGFRKISLHLLPIPTPCSHAPLPFPSNTPSHLTNLLTFSQANLVGLLPWQPPYRSSKSSPSLLEMQLMQLIDEKKAREWRVWKMYGHGVMWGINQKARLVPLEIMIILGNTHLIWKFWGKPCRILWLWIPLHTHHVDTLVDTC